MGPETIAGGEPEPPKTDGKPPRRRRKILAILASLALGCLLAEISLRIFWTPSPVFDDFDAERGLRLRPGARGWYAKEGKAWVEVNSLGYRDVEHAREKPADVFRIAVIGDSFTEARQVDLGETFWKLLESELDGAADLGGRKVEALGFGVGGYGTSQELMTLEKDVLDFAPDLVLVAFFIGNDLVNNSRSLSHRLRGDWLRPFHRLAGGELVLDDSFRERTGQLLLRRAAYFALHHSRLAELVNQVRRSLEVQEVKRELEREEARLGVDDDGARTDEIGLDIAAFAPPPAPEYVYAWAVTEALLVEMQRATVAAGARFGVVVLNDPIQVDRDVRRREEFAKSLGVEDLFYCERRLSALGERSGFPVITLAPRMQQRVDQDGVYLHGFSNTRLGSGHWNAAGHRMAAEIIAADLVALGALR